MKKINKLIKQSINRYYTIDKIKLYTYSRTRLVFTAVSDSDDCVDGVSIFSPSKMFSAFCSISLNIRKFELKIAQMYAAHQSTASSTEKSHTYVRTHMCVFIRIRMMSICLPAFFITTHAYVSERGRK